MRICICICLLAVLAGCGSVNSLAVLPIGSLAAPEPPNNGRVGNYLILNNGKLIDLDGTEKWSAGFFSKTLVTVAGTKVNFDEVSAYRRDGTYHLLKNGLELIEDGKLSVYITFQDIARNNGGSSTIRRYGYKIDNAGKMKYLSLDILKGIVKNCPTASAKLAVTNAELIKALQANPKYINEVVALYNNGCK